MTGIGPVEPYEPPDDAVRSSGLDTLDSFGPDSPRLSERWAALPPSRRRAALAGTLAIGITLAVAALLLLRPAPATPAPNPWPSQVTALRYDGPGHGPGRFRFTVSVTGTAPVTVRQLDTGLPDLTVDAAPSLPVTVDPGSPWHLTAHLTARNCAALPRGLNEPYIELTLSNRRAQQRHMFLFDGAYRRDLWRWIRASCTPTPPAPAPTHAA
ncbi:hypothetical protein ACIREE_16495 [Streptomyces sp. NPDC102467]|uniref:hypothetical protein n=1 Tax=Streptomyces sp. NPDC102467 TaxID=3366179 RepID=UPI0037FEC7A3